MTRLDARRRAELEGIGAKGKGHMHTCKVCGVAFKAKEKGQQCCSRPCQLKASHAAGWPWRGSWR